MRFLLKSSRKPLVKGIRDELFKKYNKFRYINKMGYELIHDAQLNKGLGFSNYERNQLGLEGFLPHKQFTI